MDSSSSLRDQYNPPASAWEFAPAPPKNFNASIPDISGSSSSGPSYQWSARPNRNSIFDLSPSLDINEPSKNDAFLLARSLVAAVVLEYTSTAIAMPWEVAKLLLQVQWVPRDAGDPQAEQPEVLEEIIEEDGEESDDQTEDSYFAEPNEATPARYPAPLAADEQGYVIRRSVNEDGTRPEYVIPVGSADGVWGLLTSCIQDMLSSNLQPVVQTALQSALYPTLTPFHATPLLLPVASHLITGFLLSPLDLIRTRLIVQSFLHRHRSYSGPIDAFKKIAKNEGGFSGMYLHPHLLFPTLLDNTLRPLLSLALPALLASRMRITEEANPTAWALTEFGGSCASLLVTLPIETVRRRLQVQARGKAKPIKGCVELRRMPYNGIVDAMWRILTEERSDLPVGRSRKRRQSGTAEEQPGEVEAGEGWLRKTGLGQLYRGLGLRLGAGVIVVVLAVLSGGEEKESGWAEL